MSFINIDWDNNILQIDVDVYKYMFDTLPVSVPCLTVRNVKDLSLGSW